MINLGPKANVKDFPDHQDIYILHHDMSDNNDGGEVEAVLDCNDLVNQHFNNYLNPKFLLPLGKSQQTAKFKRQKLDERGNQMGRPH